MSYHQFTSEERFCLWELLEKGHSIRAISRATGRSPSTISRELKRNRSKKGNYHPLPAQRKANQRRRHLRDSSLQRDAELKEYVITHLKQFWPPAAIAGRWALENPDRTISVSTIYRHINCGLLPEIDRKQHLRRRGKRKVNRNANFNTIHPDRIIPQWPDEIKDRMRVGDWEGDSIVGARGKGAAVTLVDRRSGYIQGAPVATRSATETRQAIVSALAGLPVHSLSLDNGSEFAEFHQLEKQLDAPIFFAEPHKPWQRGCNENANGLLRFFFPKGCDFHAISPTDFSAALDNLNHRPRKRLGWRSPFEVFFGVALA